MENKLESLNYEINKHIKNTEASRIINGYYYQFLVTVYQWIDLHIKFKGKNAEYKICCECEDDIKIETSNYIKYVQIKAYKNPLDWSNDAVKKTIYNFFHLYFKTKELKEKSIEFILESNSYIEKPEWLRRWAYEDEMEEVGKRIEDMLSKKSEDKLDTMLSNANLNDFIKLIRFTLKNEPVETCSLKEKQNIISIMEEAGIEVNKEVLIAKLLQEVIEKSVNKEEKEKELNDERIKEIILMGDKEIENSTDNEYINVIKNLSDSIIMQIKDIIEDKNIRGMRRETDKEKEERILNDSTEIHISSRSKEKESEYNLNLSEFFYEGELGTDKYRKIIDLNYWNKDIIEKIKHYFENLYNDNNKKQYLLINDMRAIHPSIVFYIGNKYYKQFKSQIYPMNANGIYFSRDCIINPKEWKIEHISLSKGNNIAAIINPTKKNKAVCNDVCNYIKAKNLEVNEIINFWLEDESKESIKVDNVWMLGNKVAKELNNYENGKLHLFFVCPNELVFIIGTLLDDRSDIILYEHFNYKGTNEAKDLYIEAIKIIE